jgi:hypothetical protein
MVKAQKYMVDIGAARARAQAYWERKRAFWAQQVFAEALNDAVFGGCGLGIWHADDVTLDIVLRPPTEAAALENLQAAIDWAREWGAADFGPQSYVEFKTRKWARAGAQTVPVCLHIKSVFELAEFTGNTGGWEQLNVRAKLLADIFAAAPVCRRAGAACWAALGGEYQCVGGVEGDKAASTQQDECDSTLLDLLKVFRAAVPKIEELLPEDFERMLGVLKYVFANGQAPVYARELPVYGIDSKWIETHKAPVLKLAEAGLGGPVPIVLKNDAQFYVKVLDPALVVGGLESFSASARQLAQIECPPKRVVICENLVSVLTFPPASDTFAIHGRGYAVGELASVGWLSHAQVWYWGDLDTNGFAILSMVRGFLPGVRSLLMDCATLEAHGGLCVAEDAPKLGVLGNLTGKEQLALEALRRERPVLRLEQERIAWDWARRYFACEGLV